MNKKQLAVVCGVFIYIVVYLIANTIFEKELAAYPGQLWTELPSILRFKLQSVANMRFFFIPMLVIAGFLFYILREKKSEIAESREDKKRRVKKFILKEGIIFISGLLISAFGIILSIGVCGSLMPTHPVLALFARLLYWLGIILALNYLIYLLIRFVLWLIKDAKLRNP